MEYPTNLGLLEEREVNPKDWWVGSVSGVDRVVLREDGDYRDFLPESEHQGGIYFDTMACVSFSALNCLEIIAKVKGWRWNRSDRFTAKMSGTTKRGNYLSKVAASIAERDGTVIEEEYPFPRRQRDPVFDWDDYYAPIPDDLVMQGKRWLGDWKVQHEWVPVWAHDRNPVKEMMKFGPMQVTVQAWPKPNADGFYENRSSDRAYNHAVTCVYYGDDYIQIYDHYTREHKKLVPTYKFGHAKLFSVKPNSNDPTQPMPIRDLPNNALVQMVGNGATGEFALHLEGTLLVDKLEKIVATWLLRSSSFDNKVAITREEWESFPKKDLKGKVIE